MTENKIEEITVNNATEKEIILRTLMQLVEKFNRGHWGDIQLFEDEESRYSMAIEKIIEEIQEYRAIGTVEYLKDELYALRTALDFYQNIGSVTECRKAVEQQTPMKPDYIADGYADGLLCYDYAKCPICGHDFEYGINDWGSDYCSDCGQKLGWKEVL